MKYTDFCDDEDKMRDFKILSKEAFLKSYSYLTEEEYDLTKNKVTKEVNAKGDEKDHYFLFRGDQEDFIVKYRGKISASELEARVVEVIGELDAAATDVPPGQVFTYAERTVVEDIMNYFKGVKWEIVDYYDADIC